MTFLKALVASAGFVVLCAPSAGAVDVRQVAEIKAAPAVVWDKIGGWCAIKDWHPVVTGCDDSKKGLRVLTLKDGAKIVEKLLKTGKNSYSYAIIDGPLPVKNYTATLTAKPDSLGTTDLTWTARFDAKGKTDAEAAAAITGVFEAGLKNIKEKVTFDATKPAMVATAAAAAAAATASGSKDDAKMKAREERKKRFEEAKLVVLEKVAKAKAEFAKLRVELAEKAKVAADAAKATYEKAKAALATAAAPGTTAKP